MDGNGIRGWSAAAASVARDFLPWRMSGARAVDEVSCLAAVLLAIAAAHMLGIGNVGWAAFSAFIVIRGTLADTAWRGALRVAGTAAGVTLAWLLAPVLLGSTVLLSLALAVVGGATLYLCVLDRRGYGWLLAGLSFAMVLIDGMQDSSVALAAFARARLTEVSVGTAAAVLVSALSALVMQRAAGAVAAPVLQFWHKAACLHALQGALALALIPWVWTAWHIKALSQSSITIMAVMMVPAADLAASDSPAATRLRHRFFGCCIGGLLATGILLLSHASPIVMTLAACLGVAAGRHIENAGRGIEYVGTQLALAFLVVLVPDNYASVDAATGLQRLFGIVLGMLLLEVVRRFLKTKRGKIPGP
ncbi:FUSC family protein [Pseudoduganella sp. FT25W]|uniref:FUSC family protein n=1 Tax=Duganella alba TaxID=2666081 RepID=A0A6L5QK52_9BURK|nr:FUSC family protein [Duganella alba]MRX10174.1 FUSC family protein [Duganella alba]MRX16638.1 FUSC family protein [Duganella alba]